MDRKGSLARVYLTNPSKLFCNENGFRGKGELLIKGVACVRLLVGMWVCMYCSTWHSGGGPFQIPSPTLATIVKERSFPTIKSIYK